jgi:hypothetical protein
MIRLRIAGALLSALAHAADPEPSRGCAPTSGRSADGTYEGKLTICFTKYRKYSSARAIRTWSEQHLFVVCDLSTKKDGVQARKERWGKQTESTRSADRTAHLPSFPLCLRSRTQAEAGWAAYWFSG